MDISLPKFGKANAAQQNNKAQANKAGEQGQQEPVPQDPQDSVSTDHYRPSQELMYATGAGLVYGMSEVAQSFGGSSGYMQAAGAAIGGVLTLKGIQELATAETTKGKASGAIHTAIGASTVASAVLPNAAGYLTGLSAGLTVVNGAMNRPGTIIKEAGKEFGQSVIDIASPSKWKSPQAADTKQA